MLRSIYPNLLIILASKYVYLKIVNHFFFFFSNCLLMLVQMETFVFPFSCVPILVWVLPEADVETQIQVQFI